MKKSILRFICTSLCLLAVLLTFHVVSVNAASSDEFVIKDGTLERYTGKDAIVVIPDTVKNIYWHAFASNRYIKEVVIPSSATTIGTYAFSGCTSLTKVTMADHVTSIGSCAFSGCTSLTSLQLSNALTKIPKWMASGCRSLSSITIPDSVKKIEDNSFYATGLTSIHIPKNVSYFSIRDAFRESNSLKKLTISSKNKTYTMINDLLYSKDKSTLYYIPDWISGTIQLSKYTKNIDSYALNLSDKITGYAISTQSKYYKTENGILYSKNGSELVSCPTTKEGTFIVPSSVRTIKSSAFSGCTKLSSIKLLSGTKRIECFAFSDCTSIKEFDVVDSVVFLGDHLFEGCTSLDKIIIPSSVTSLEHDDWTWDETHEDLDDTEFTKASVTIVYPKGSYFASKITYTPCFASTFQTYNFVVAKTNTIKFDATYGSVKSKSKKVIENCNYGVLPTPTRKGYTFAGWYTKKKGGCLVTADIACPASAILYAHWNKVKVDTPSLSLRSSKKHTLTIQLNAVSGAKGYLIRYSTSKNFKWSKTVTSSSTSKTISNLLSKKRYYVKVKAYKKDSTGAKIYGHYSSVRSIKIK